MNTEGDKRIVLVSSVLANSGVWDPHNLHGDNSYSRLKFYGNSKLYNVSMFYYFKLYCYDINISIDHDNVCTAEESNG